MPHRASTILEGVCNGCVRLPSLRGVRPRCGGLRFCGWEELGRRAVPYEYAHACVILRPPTAVITDI